MGTDRVATVNKKPILLPLGVALAAMFPQGSQAKVADAGLSVGRAQAAVTKAFGDTPSAQTPLLALPNGDAVPGYARHHSHHSHYSHRSHYSSSGGGHYSHSSHSSHYSSS
jgi:hypothetical protein